MNVDYALSCIVQIQGHGILTVFSVTGWPATRLIHKIWMFDRTFRIAKSLSVQSCAQQNGQFCAYSPSWRYLHWILSKLFPIIIYLLKAEQKKSLQSYRRVCLCVRVNAEVLLGENVCLFSQKNKTKYIRRKCFVNQWYI